MTLYGVQYSSIDQFFESVQFPAFIMITKDQLRKYIYIKNIENIKNGRRVAKNFFIIFSETFSLCLIENIAYLYFFSKNYCVTT